MVFKSGSNSYRAARAVDVIRAMERDEGGYSSQGASVQQFLQWSLERLDAHIPLRDLFLGMQVDDETLALSYLLLLEQYGLGELFDDPEPIHSGELQEHDLSDTQAEP